MKTEMSLKIGDVVHEDYPRETTFLGMTYTQYLVEWGAKWGVNRHDAYRLFERLRKERRGNRGYHLSGVTDLSSETE